MDHRRSLRHPSLPALTVSMDCFSDQYWSACLMEDGKVTEVGQSEWIADHPNSQSARVAAYQWAVNRIALLKANHFRVVRRNRPAIALDSGLSTPVPSPLVALKPIDCHVRSSGHGLAPAVF